MAFITGNSNYPADFDLNPTGTGVLPHFNLVLDQIRDQSTGVITQSGNTVIAVDVNSLYSSVDKMQRILGNNIQGGHPTLDVRLDFLELSGSQAFVSKTGSTMTGDLVMAPPTVIHVGSLSGTAGLSLSYPSGVSWATSGTYTINNSGNIVISALNTSNIDFVGTTVTTTATNTSIISSSDTTIRGDATVSITGNNVKVRAGANIIELTSTGSFVGATITPTGSNSVDLGSPTNRFRAIYADNLNSTGLNTALSGTYINRSGGDLYGILNVTGNGSILLGTGNSIFNISSGTNFLGNSDGPFSGTWTQELYVHQISGLSQISFLSDIEFGFGTKILAAATGVFIGSPSIPIDKMWVNEIIGATGLNADQFVNITGDTILGHLQFTGLGFLTVSESGMTAQTSGTADIGSTGIYFNNVYTDMINDRPQADVRFHEPFTGTVDGANTAFTLTNSPNQNNLMVFLDGIYQRPVDDYTLAGATVTFVVAPTTRPDAGFYLF